MAREVLLVQDSKFASRPVHDLVHTCTKHTNPDGNNSMAISLFTPKVREVRQICDRQFMLPRRLGATRSSRREEVWQTVGVIAKEAQAEKPIELRNIFGELALRLSCRTIFNKAFVGSELTGESALSPEVFWKLDAELAKLLVAQNPSDIIPSLKPFGGIFGVNKRWQAVYPSMLQISSRLTDWYRKNAPNAHLEDESSLDFLEVVMRKDKEGTVNKACVN